MVKFDLCGMYINVGMWLACENSFGDSKFMYFTVYTVSGNDKCNFDSTKFHFTVNHGTGI